MKPRGRRIDEKELKKVKPGEIVLKLRTRLGCPYCKSVSIDTYLDGMVIATHCPDCDSALPLGLVVPFQLLIKAMEERGSIDDKEAAEQVLRDIATGKLSIEPPAQANGEGKT